MKHTAFEELTMPASRAMVRGAVVVQVTYCGELGLKWVLEWERDQVEMGRRLENRTIPPLYVFIILNEGSTLTGQEKGNGVVGGASRLSAPAAALIPPSIHLTPKIE